jgi:hypothetical protein
MPVVWSFIPEQQYWIIEPLIEAGLDLDEVRDLIFRLGFEAIVSEGADTVGSVQGVVSDQPADVQAAWTEVIGRMIGLYEPSGQSPSLPYPRQA